MREVNVHTSILCWFTVFFFITPGKQAELPSDVQVKCSCRLLYIIRVSNNSHEERWEPCTCGCMDTHLSSATAPQKLVVAAFVEFIAQCEEIRLWVTPLCMISTNVFCNPPPPFQWQICPKTFSLIPFLLPTYQTLHLLLSIQPLAAVMRRVGTGCVLDVTSGIPLPLCPFASALSKGRKQAMVEQQWQPRCVAAWISGPSPESTE